MDETHLSPAQARDRFVAALERAKGWIGSTPGPDGKRREGSNRSLSQEVGVSPSRIGEFLNGAFNVSVTHVPDATNPPPRAKKAIVGFTTSVERTLKWLVFKGLDVDPNEPAASGPRLRTDDIVRGYWPYGIGDTAAEQLFQDAVKEGKSVVEPETDRLSRVEVMLKVLPWGPFGEVERVEGGVDQPTGFLRTYGAAMLRGIDPVDCQLDFEVAKSLEAALDLPARGRRDKWVATLGLYDTLHRRFGGFRFVTFPVRVPLVGLLVRKEGVAGSPLGFQSQFGRETQTPMFAVHREVGHLFLGSILDQERIRRLEAAAGVAVIAETLRRTVRAEGAAAFLSDGVLALEVFSILSRQKGIVVEPIAQEENRETELSYRIGFMLRDEDKDLGHLLEASQRELFRASWRAADLFEALFKGIEHWADSQELEEHGWNKVIFFLDNADLRGIVENAVQISELSQMACDLTEKYPKTKLLFKCGAGK